MKLAGAARQQHIEAITTQEVGELPADYTGIPLSKLLREVTN